MKNRRGNVIPDYNEKKEGKLGGIMLSKFRVKKVETFRKLLLINTLAANQLE